jgi:hypothetical protein
MEINHGQKKGVAKTAEEPSNRAREIEINKYVVAGWAIPRVYKKPATGSAEQLSEAGTEQNQIESDSQGPSVVNGKRQKKN